MQYEDILDVPAPAVRPTLIYSKLLSRILAFLVDMVVFIGLNMFLQLATQSSLPQIAVQFIALIFGLFYNVFLVQRYGGTPGKMARKLTIVKNDGTRLSWGGAIMRYAVTLLFFVYALLPWIAGRFSPAWQDRLYTLMTTSVSIGSGEVPVGYNSFAVALWYVISLIVISVDKRRRAPHDFIAGTVVVRKG